MSLVLQSSGGGSVTVQEPTTASNFTATMPAATGTVMVSGNMPAFSATAASGTSLSAGAWTKVTYDSEEFDTNNNFASSRFTPTVAGYYQINAMIYWNTSTANERVAGIYKNGALFKTGQDILNIGNICSGVTALIYLNGSTDYVEIYGYTGTSITTGISTNTAYFQGAMVRSA